MSVHSTPHIDNNVLCCDIKSNDKLKLYNSKLFCDLAQYCNTSDDITNVTTTFYQQIKQRFNCAADVYFSYADIITINSNNLPSMIDTSTLMSCFELCNYVDDEQFLVHCVIMMFELLSLQDVIKFVDTCKEHINAYIEYNVLLHYPLFMVPDILFNDKKFFDAWTVINNYNEFIIGDDVYMYIIIRYGDDDGNRLNMKPHHKLITDVNFTIHGTELSWYYDDDYSSGVKNHIHFETPYVKDSKHGISYEYYVSGELHAEYYYDNNLLHGTSRIWYCSNIPGQLGTLKCECNFDNDQLHGRSIYYDGQGQITVNWLFDHNTRIQ